MQIALINGNKVTRIGDYRELFPNTSFTANGPDDAFLIANNAKRVNVWLPYNPMTQKLIACDPYIDGPWVYTIQVTDLTPAEIQALKDTQWATVRADRNRRLAECDWTQLADVPLTTEERAAWVTYRQALRDVTDQLDPYNIVWPVAPSGSNPLLADDEEV